MQVLLETPAAWVALCAVLGLLVGSFLNVVIHRLPLIMQRGWRQECRSLLELEAQEEAPLSLSQPRSRCPSCARPIRWYENIPVASYLALRGRCAGCGKPISLRYPAVEILAALAAALVAAAFGPTLFGVGAIVLSWALIAASGIDLDHQLLPDSIVLPMLWLGLVIAALGGPVPPADAVIGAAAGYLSLWLVYHGFRLATGKEGMGYGDFKLMAVFGAWLGWSLLPLVILLSSLVGAVVGIALMATGKLERGKPMPFGPFIAAAGWIALLWGEQLVAGYLQIAGL
ncbi:prepilin peptidase [bacterium]|nr:prepilin peptidase [bacterium]